MPALKETRRSLSKLSNNNRSSSVLSNNSSKSRQTVIQNKQKNSKIGEGLNSKVREPSIDFDNIL